MTRLNAIVTGLEAGKDFLDLVCKETPIIEEWEVLISRYKIKDFIINDKIKTLLTGYPKLDEELLALIFKHTKSSRWIADALAEAKNFDSLILSDVCDPSQMSHMLLFFDLIKDGKYLEELYKAAKEIDEINGMGFSNASRNANEVFRQIKIHQPKFAKKYNFV